MILSGRVVLSVLTGCLTMAFAGCASPGIPRPPSLHLPATVTDLTATRIGDRVELHWTAPEKTTDGLDLTLPTRVEICRNPAAATTQCTVVLSLAGHEGPSTATDHLPPSLLTEASPRTLLAYRIRILNPSGRSAPPSPPSLIPAGPNASTVEAFRAMQQRDGVLLEWRNSPSETGTVDVIRTVQTAPGDKPPKFPQTRLRPATAGRNGMIDQGSLQNQTYTYQAQRVLTISIAGGTLDIRSEPTPPVTIALRDSFPPEPPRGLVTVPGTPGPTIDLSWQPNNERDVAGYRIYRRDLGQSGEKSVRLTENPLPGPAYRDAAVLPGHRYEYRVTAIDRSGNESAPSAAALDSPEGR